VENSNRELEIERRSDRDVCEFLAFSLISHHHFAASGQEQQLPLAYMSSYGVWHAIAVVAMLLAFACSASAQLTNSTAGGSPTNSTCEASVQCGDIYVCINGTCG
jgi:hypothetical protein